MSNECTCPCRDKGPHAYHFEGCPMRDHPESLKSRLKQALEENHRYITKIHFWLIEKQRWEGKYHIVKRENNALRKKLYSKKTTA